MEEKSSCSWSEVQKIHNRLILELINGHVGHREKAKTYVRWKMGFRNHCDDATEQEGDVMGNFEYLEENDKFSPGNYDVLKEIFNGDKKALRKIENATKEIETIKSTMRSSNRGSKDEIARHVKISVDIKYRDMVYLRKIATFLRNLVDDLRSEFQTLPWIERGYTIVQDDKTEGPAKLCSKMKNVQENLEKLLLEEHINESRANYRAISKKILGVYFALLNAMEKELVMTMLQIGWDERIIIIGRMYTGDISDRYNCILKNRIVSCFEQMFFLNEKGNEAAVVIEKITPSDAENMKQKLSRIA